MNPHIFNLVERTLREPIVEYYDLKKGLTNRNYVVKTLKHTVVVRVPFDDQAQIVNRKHEALAIDLVQAHQLDFEVLYFDVKTGIKITTYVPDFESFEETAVLDRIQRTANLMRRLHAIQQTIGHCFDPIARYQQYRSYVKKPLIKDQYAEQVLDRFSRFTPRLTLCHNDWVAGNIGFTPSKDYLIDYEYAGDNDPFFDVMSFITENQLSAQEEQAFLDAYFLDGLSKSDKDTLALYRDVHNLLWCTWAIMMYESRQETVYYDIAQQKQDAFFKNHT
jgi:thiamine kinase-like enzyme